MIDAWMFPNVPLPTLPESPKDYWKRTPDEKTADDDSVRLYHGVGQAMSGWENLENSFAMLFGLLVDSPTRAALRAYGGIASHRGRKDALENAAEVFLVVHSVPQVHRDYFGKLMNHFGYAAARRNEIAHAISTSVRMHDDPPRVFLLPADYNSNKTTAYRKGEDRWSALNADYRYSNADLDYFIDGFTMLRRAADALIGQLNHLYGNPERS